MNVAGLDDPALRADFLPDRDSGKRPLRRDKAYPELRDGMSTFGSLEAARTVWRDIHTAARRRGQEVELGEYIAEVDLEPGGEFDIEDLQEPDEHLTIWGDPDRLVAAVRQTYPALTEEE
ncbi:MAG: hypothetical protein ACYC91_20225 [Solirubrobacteraceae bacterium]